MEEGTWDREDEREREGSERSVLGVYIEERWRVMVKLICITIVAICTVLVTGVWVRFYNCSGV